MLARRTATMRISEDGSESKQHSLIVLYNKCKVANAAHACTSHLFGLGLGSIWAHMGNAMLSFLLHWLDIVWQLCSTVIVHSEADLPFLSVGQETPKQGTICRLAGASW